MSENVNLQEVLGQIKATRAAVLEELQKIIVGQTAPMEQLLTAMFVGGHCLIQGPLASAKTILVGSVAEALELDFKRIQFTPDLMPADISGTEILEEDTATGHRTSKFVQGPVFTNILMADEINRTPPKTQAALLEVMQEKQVTLGGRTYPLPQPFFVFATQVSMEQEGTYPLPEAQQDRFMFSIMMEYLNEDEELAVIRKSTGDVQTTLNKVIGAEELIYFNQAIKHIKLPEHLGSYIVDIVANSRPTIEGATDFVKEYIVWGAGLRASQNISLAAKSMAAQEASDTVTIEHIQKVLAPVLRHRIGLSFRAEVDNITIEDVIQKVVEMTKSPAGSNMGDN